MAKLAFEIRVHKERQERKVYLQQKPTGHLSLQNEPLGPEWVVKFEPKTVHVESKRCKNNQQQIGDSLLLTN